MAASERGFLARWSQRKGIERQGLPLPEPEPATPAAEHAGAVQPDEPETPAPPPLNLDDVAALTPQSDYSRFVARDVDGPVRNAALKKLFSDPQFNVMDGLDTYIDDYGKPDPIPESMLRQMAQAQFLGLFNDEKAPEVCPRTAEPVTEPTVERITERTTEPMTDEDPDLRLQSHDAAGQQSPEPGAEQDPGREH